MERERAQNGRVANAGKWQTGMGRIVGAVEEARGILANGAPGRRCVGYGGIPCDEPVRGPGMTYCESCARDRKLERGR